MVRWLSAGELLRPERQSHQCHVVGQPLRPVERAFRFSDGCFPGIHTAPRIPHYNEQTGNLICLASVHLPKNCSQLSDAISASIMGREAPEATEEVWEFWR